MPTLYSGPVSVLALNGVDESVVTGRFPLHSSRIHTYERSDEMLSDDDVDRIAGWRYVTQSPVNPHNMGATGHFRQRSDAVFHTPSFGYDPSYFFRNADYGSVCEFINILASNWAAGAEEAYGYDTCSRYCYHTPANLFFLMRDQYGDPALFRAYWSTMAGYPYSESVKVGLVNVSVGGGIWNVNDILGVLCPDFPIPPRQRREPGPDIATPAFGVELEVLCSDKSGLSDFLSEYEIPCDSSMEYTHSVTPYWKMVPDSSLPSYGIELVSPVLTHPTGLDSVKSVTRALSSAGASTSTACGFHIHHNARYLSGAQVATVALAYAAAQPVISALMPKSRRDNHMCQPLGYSVLDSLRNIRRTQDGKDAAGYACGSRYTTVNLTALQRHGTIEFRQHSGTINYRKIAMWTEFTGKLVSMATDGTLDPDAFAPFADLYNPPVSAVSELCGIMGLPKDSAAYWDSRYDAFAPVSHHVDQSDDEVM